MNVYPPPPPWASEITSVGVTGTNGKTSTTRFVCAGLAADVDDPIAHVTTVSSGFGDEHGSPPADHDAFLQLMRRLYDRGGRRAAIEATSASLGLGFARAWPFRVGVFTNLGHDHQRTHGSFEHYLASKAQLFVALPPGGVAVLNAADPHTSLIAEVLPAGVRALYFAGPEAVELAVPIHLRILSATPTWSGLQLELAAAPELGPIPRTLKLRALPRFQAPNAAAALLACLALGINGHAAALAIANATPPPGRFELIQPPSPHASAPRVIIDYAHTPEALTAALHSARALCSGRIILVIGSGGDTDPAKRPPLGAAARVADHVWLTNDNPRHEDPAQIVEGLRQGLGGARHEVELDRRQAIASAIHSGACEDLVLIAGKGHERHQEIAGQQLPCSDHELALAALAPGPPHGHS
ncbi:UDP-N-acetylmuramoylalanyl-D-glutamate--2,6-diaminopimelate ligase [Enhygromyxa salina]|uniref:UDP-N-acetylmuramoylalanyl-D-glutamate--2, 6-diaminopimelate ligase n=1 Tax=Enhygromyxa salina TaxID=215803 RepID=A0A0C2CX15_9BACT|nr:UDP-N-acetylmuramyl-tripeptide synthetase [Enhygromyxa salina]KIG15576.1 UDP-N-acetylmuramoylalanyl-D-glutamate--2,6-diaminopimelate ligase [Enhygromyxa salina]